MVQDEVGTAELQQCQSRDRQLLEAHQDLADAVQPRMAHFDPPASRLIGGMLALFLLLLATWANMCDIPALRRVNVTAGRSEAGIQRQVARFVQPLRRSRQHERRYRL